MIGPWLKSSCEIHFLHGREMHSAVESIFSLGNQMKFLKRKGQDKSFS